MTATTATPPDDPKPGAPDAGADAPTPGAIGDDDADDPCARLLDAALPHVPFDGWSETTFAAAIADSGLDAALARAVCPRGGVDLALAWHARGDRAMMRRIAATDLSAMRYRDRVATAVRFRLEAAGDREAMRRSLALFALPRHAADGARALWNTADAVWTALGDSSEDINWYTKRATLSAVWSATVLYWLGDQSEDSGETWAFLDRRIDNVMQFEKIRARVRENPLCRPLLAVPGWLLDGIPRPPSGRDGLPGTLRGRG